MREMCQPPNLEPRRPVFRCPPGTTDCHVHVYGPNDRYPVADTRAFDVPEAEPKALRHMLDTLGIERVVLVQPSTYGTNNQRHLDALTELGRPARMIAALNADIDQAELIRLDGLGVCGVRYTIGHRGAVPLSEMPVLAERIKQLGWHIQLHVMNDGGQAPLAEMEDTLTDLPTDIVIDHIGSISPVGGVEQRNFQSLLRLVKTGKCWIKLSGGYRVSKLPPPYNDMLPFVHALIDTRPDRLVWASDWPHVAFKGTMPNTTDLFDLLQTWVPDEVTRKMILVDNPAVLYGF